MSKPEKSRQRSSGHAEIEDTDFTGTIPPRSVEKGDRSAQTASAVDPSPKPTAVHRWGFGVFFLSQLVFLLSSVFVVAPFGDTASDPSLRPAVLLIGLIVPTVLSATVVVVATLIRGNGPRADLGLRWSWADVRTGLGLGAVGIVLTLGASRLWTNWVGEDQATSAVGSLLDDLRLPPVLAVLIFLHLLVLAPLCEELVFRGALWGAMDRLRWSRWTAFGVTTALFAVAHLEPARTPLLLVIGIPIGLARLFTGRLLAAVVAHQVNNLLPALGVLLLALGVIPT
ncbi:MULTISPECIES: type II CAAX endopeptidase family protein [Actinoalloteichus]|uniref:type II CAAX endopeptidase family protein n=1 Tax=Actinoalloteichus TaxID=65496 RepID=UPI001E52295E|nr:MULTISPECIES: type II CAAX endopeptidase family protein [Actinoalloteichus]